MTEKFNTKNVINYFFWSMFLCLGNPFYARMPIAVTAQAEVYSSVFYKVKEPINVILNTISSDQANSLSECALKCLSQNCICYSFNKLLQRCDMGKCKSTDTSTSTSNDYYVTCNTKAGFRLLTRGSITTCVWESTNKADFITASDDCRAKDAYLYTAKTIEKFGLLQNYVGKIFWIGLNDLEVEDEFRWEDDNTIVDATLKRQFFATGEPNGYRNENCALYGFLKDSLIDGSCYEPNYYICEQNLFNSP